MDKLEVRPFEAADIAQIAAWFADEAAVVLWGGPNVRWPLDAAQFEQMRADPARTLWTATVRGVLAGHFQLFGDGRVRSARLGRVGIAPPFRGKRLATPMVRLASDLAFTGDPALHRMELYVYEGNAAAKAAYERAGFKVEGVLRESVPVVSGGRTVFWNTVVMSMLRAEWAAWGSLT